MHFEIDFYNFINGYRVTEFKKEVLKSENKNFTLSAIAMRVGFNSKSSFNRIFKTITNTTPRDYLKEHRKENTIIQTNDNFVGIGN